MPRDLGVVDRYQQHEIPQVAVQVTQYDQHAVRVRVRAGAHRGPARRGPAGPVGYGPNLAAFAVYLMVVHFVPAHRCVALLESLTGAAPSVGFVHGLLARTAGLLVEVDKRIRTLITLAYAVCCDETPLGSGRAPPGRARRRPTSTCWWPAPSSTPTTCWATGTWTPSRRSSHRAARFGDRARPLPELRLAPSSPGWSTNCAAAHLLRDLEDAAEVYPDAHWPAQIAGALRELIHQANLARDAGHDASTPTVRDTLISGSATASWSDCPTPPPRHPPRERKARLLLEVLRDRQADVLRFAHDLKVPPTYNQAERDLRPGKTPTEHLRPAHQRRPHPGRYNIRGYVSTAAKHGRNSTLSALRDALLGRPWIQRSQSG